MKRGRDGAGGQRFLCRGCGRSFTRGTNRIFATTKLPRETWMRFVRCHVDVLTLRESADVCGVSLKTSFFMRHRILEALTANVPAFRSAAGDGVELDECFIAESFKGRRANAACGIPRRPRHRRGPIDQYERICVLTGVNDAGDFFYEMTGRGTMDGEQAARMLAGKIASGVIASTDGAKSYRKALKELDVRRHIETPGAAHVINRVNGLHSRIKEFLDAFHGVATRRLPNYLAWFKWIWTFKRSRGASATADLVIRQASSNPYRTTRRSYKNTPYPFYEYWVKQAKWDATARSALPLAGLAVSIAG